MGYSKIENLENFKKEEKLLAECFAKRTACVNKLLTIQAGKASLTVEGEQVDLAEDETEALAKVYESKIEKCDAFILKTLQARK